MANPSATCGNRKDGRCPTVWGLATRDGCSTLLLLIISSPQLGAGDGPRPGRVSARAGSPYLQRIRFVDLPFARPWSSNTSDGPHAEHRREPFDDLKRGRLHAKLDSAEIATAHVGPVRELRLAHITRFA